MRNHTLHEAQSRLAFDRLATVVRVYKNWRFRSSMRVLLAMDDHMLKDIGLTRDSLAQLLRRPLTLDTQWEAERLRLIGSNRRDC